LLLRIYFIFIFIFIANLTRVWQYAGRMECMIALTLMSSAMHRCCTVKVGDLNHHILSEVEFQNPRRRVSTRVWLSVLFQYAK